MMKMITEETTKEEFYFEKINKVEIDGKTYFAAKQCARLFQFDDLLSAIRICCRNLIKIPKDNVEGNSLMNYIPIEDVVTLLNVSELTVDEKVAYQKSIKKYLPMSEDSTTTEIEEPLPVEETTSLTENCDSDIRTFVNNELGQIRTLMIEGEPWFVGKDVAEILGYSNINKAIQMHVDDEDKKILDYKGFSHFGNTLWDKANDFSNKIIINESGLYSLILKSKLPSAKQFKRWVTSEVMPSIHKRNNTCKEDKNSEIIPKNEQQTNPVSSDGIPSFEGVRGYIDNNNIAWLNIEDVAIGLGLSFVAKSGNAVVRWDRVRSYLSEYDYNENITKDSYVPENVFYLLAMKSNSKTAISFQKKVANEILPTIRKTGGYISNCDKIVNTYFGDASTSQQGLVKEFLKRIEAQQSLIIKKDKEIETQNKEIDVLKPKATYCDLVLQCTNLVPITTIAQDYGMSARKMNQLLNEYGIQYRQGKMWRLYSKYLGNGYTDIKTHYVESWFGKDYAHCSMQWTQKGRLFLYDKLKEKGILPEMERE